MKSCFCFDLKTGGLIIAALTIFNGFSISLTSKYNEYCYGAHFVSGVIVMLIGGFCYYGIEKNRYSYMVPYLVLAWISPVLCVILLIYIPIDWFGTGYFKIIFLYTNDFKTENDLKITQAVFCVTWISIAVYAAIGLYFFMVMEALYKSIKTAEHEKLPNFQTIYDFDYLTKEAGFDYPTKNSSVKHSNLI